MKIVQESWWWHRISVFWVLPWLIWDFLKKSFCGNCKIKGFRQTCAPEALGCRLQNVPLGKNQSLRISKEGGRKGGRGGERVWSLNRQSFLTVRRRWRRSVSESLIESIESWAHLFPFCAVCWGVRKTREFSFGNAQVPVPCNRMHLVVEPIKQAVMKMLPVFMDKAGLTQHEINHMWVQFIISNRVGAHLGAHPQVLK